MKVFLKKRNSSADAQGEFNEKTQELIVLKGSKVSKNISASPSFKGSSRIKKEREEHVQNGIVVEDVRFKSSSTAANFVTGNSTNGLRSWKTEDGLSLKEVLG